MLKLKLQYLATWCEELTYLKSDHSFKARPIPIFSFWHTVEDNVWHPSKGTKMGTGWCFSSVQLLSRVWLFATPWITAHQASLSITNSWSLLKLMSIESVMPFNHLLLCRPLLLPPSISPSIRVFSNESGLHIRWPKYWGFHFSISPFNEYSGLISFRMDWLDLLAV